MLTTVCVPQYDLGRVAADALIRHLHSSEAATDIVDYPLTLTIRHSCGARRISNEDRRLMLRQVATSAGVGLPAKATAAS
jgi:hypothetical protein